LGLQGDNDPVDVIEIGSAANQCGGVYKIKPLGVFAMIDEGELDWKVVAICIDDPMASQLNDVQDVERCVGTYICTC
jgi:inorganic pyrophosphatase